MGEIKAFNQLPIDITEKIKSCILSSDIEMLFYQLKNGERGDIVQAFSNEIRNLIDDLIEEKENNSYNLVKTAYDCVVESFQSVENEWNCANCGNRNFRKYIGGKMENIPTWCSLCG
eukprot:241914_1